MSRFADWLSGPRVTPEPAVQMYTDTFGTRLPSVLPGADFHGRFTVSWYGRPPDYDADLGIIRRSIPEWAAKHTAKASAARMDAAQREIGAAFAQIRAIGGTHIRLAGATVILTATPQAQQMAQEWENTERQRAAGRLRRQLELDEIAYLRDEIFSHPETARCFWLKHHPGALNDLLDDRFERIAATLDGSGSGSGFGSGPDGGGDAQRDVARVVLEFLDGLTAADRGYLIDQVARVFCSFDRDDLADRLPGRTASAAGEPGATAGEPAAGAGEPGAVAAPAPAVGSASVPASRPGVVPGTAEQNSLLNAG